jgi:Ca2+-binding RTX toxin-like protein
LALKDDRTVWAWGQNGSGELGDGTTTNRKAPVQVSSLRDVTDVAVGFGHSLAVSTMAPIYCKRGQVVCRGTEAHDYVIGTPYQDTVKAGSGKDQIYSQAANDSVYGGDNYDVIHGSNGSDRLYGGSGNDFMYTGGRDRDIDSVNCGAGRDTVWREKGTDEVVDCEIIRNYS